MIQGSGITQLAKTIQDLGYQSIPQLELARVLSPPPHWRLQLTDQKIELDQEDVIVSQHLLAQKEKLILHFEAGPQEVEVTRETPIKAGDQVLVCEMIQGQFYAVLAKIGGAEDGDQSL